MSANTTPLVNDPTASLRRSVYLILILISFGMITAHIIGVERVIVPRIVGKWPINQSIPQPTHADNDRSRWATIRALVEQDTYAIGIRVFYDEAGTVYEDQGQIKDSGFGTIDKVLKPTADWKNDSPQPNEPFYARYFYSSKPPLLPTVLAGEYWIINKLTQWISELDNRIVPTAWTLTNDGRWAVVRIILFTVNALPWLIAMLLMARLIEQLGTTDVGRIAAMAAVCFCTFVNAFASTLNNHTIAAWSVVFAVYPVAMSVLRAQPMSFLTSLMAGFWAGWTVTNELPAAAFAGLLGLWVLIQQPRAIIPFIIGLVVPAAGFLLTNFLSIGTIIPAYEKFGTEWYHYAGSFWRPEIVSGIDKPKDSTPVYLFHLTFGHHGLFSLTPVLLLALFSLLWPLMGQAEDRVKRVRCILGWGTLVLSLVILGFYLSKTESYNYGGWTSGPRWFIWLTPLWILGAVPMFDVLARSLVGRGIMIIALGWSALSVAFPTHTPWQHPWLFRLLEHLGLINYN
ncbi:MAG TPA: hypothetical protein PLN21_15090 [Gemmatales bacterium]|nr:hypothetical protein [Gemmatales bacterium]